MPLLSILCTFTLILQPCRASVRNHWSFLWPRFGPPRLGITLTDMVGSCTDPVCHYPRSLWQLQSGWMTCVLCVSFVFCLCVLQNNGSSEPRWCSWSWQRMYSWMKASIWWSFSLERQQWAVFSRKVATRWPATIVSSVKAWTFYLQGAMRSLLAEPCEGSDLHSM